MSRTSSGRQLAKNVLALECIIGYARLLENALSFPSDALLPSPVSQLEQGAAWEWDLFENEINFGAHVQKADDESVGKASIVYALEQDLAGINNATSTSEHETEVPFNDILSKSDWDILQEIERSEEVELLEIEEVCSPAASVFTLNFLPTCFFPLSVYFALFKLYLRDQKYYFFSFCSFKRGWNNMLDHGMIYIVMLGNLRN